MQSAGMCNSHRRTVLLVLVMLVYLLIGTIVFMAIEQPLEKNLRQDVTQLRDRFITAHDCLSGLVFYSFLTCLYIYKKTNIFYIMYTYIVCLFALKYIYGKCYYLQFKILCSYIFRLVLSILLHWILILTHLYNNVACLHNYSDS